MHPYLLQLARCARRVLPKAPAMLLGMLASTEAVWGAPVVQQVSGPLDHNATITISGSGFGSKSTPAPLVWDNASGNALTDKWSGGWPSMLPGYNVGYYSPMRGINTPHPRDTRYIAGAHADNGGPFAGYMVMIYKTIPLPPLPFYIYASWYQRADDQWHFGGDNNYKTFDYSEGESPYASFKSWYTCYGPPHPDSRTGEAQWVTEAGTPLNDRNGHNSWWAEAVNPMAGQWSKVEIAIKVTDQPDGYINVWENGHSVINYVGLTDNYGGTKRTIGVGGYARMQGYTSNWRYFDDVYVDTTLSRIVLADKPVLSAATIIENQIPSAWSDNSLTATVNLGKFTQGQPVYLFVVDSTGTPSAAGLALSAGGTFFTPNAPGAVSVH
jgi:hypothetical protein